MSVKKQELMLEAVLKVLEFYANEDNYYKEVEEIISSPAKTWSYHTTPIQQDTGEKARMIINNIKEIMNES